MRTVPLHIGRPDYADTSIPLSEQLARRSSSIKVLSADEIKKMRHVCKVNFSCTNKHSMHFLCEQLAREVLDEAAKAIKPGVTADEIDRVVHEVI